MVSRSTPTINRQIDELVDQMIRLLTSPWMFSTMSYGVRQLVFRHGDGLTETCDTEHQDNTIHDW